MCYITDLSHIILLLMNDGYKVSPQVIGKYLQEETHQIFHIICQSIDFLLLLHKLLLNLGAQDSIHYVTVLWVKNLRVA